MVKNHETFFFINGNTFRYESIIIRSVSDSSCKGVTFFLKPRLMNTILGYVISILSKSKKACVLHSIAQNVNKTVYSIFNEILQYFKSLLVG